MRTAIPGRGALRSQGTNPHQPTYNRKQRGAPGWCSLLFRNGKRDPHSRRGASDFPRIVANTPGPWKGRIEVAGNESPFSSHISTRKGEPFWFSLFSLSGKRDSDPRPQPWQGCALPTELFQHDVSLNASAKVTKISESPNFSRTNPYFLSPHPAVAPPLAAQTGKQKLPSPATADQIAHAFPFAVLCRKRPFGHPFPRLPKHEPATSVVFLHGIFSEILSLWA